MSYSDFTLDRVLQQFQLTLDEQVDLWEGVGEVIPSDHLQITLDENIPLALSIHTEKARSELIVVPILVELRKRLNHRISLFSGVNFNVDQPSGLNGVCDYIISNSPEQLLVRAPILAIVEAKNDNIKSGYGQCIASMVAAQLFNERAGNGITTIYGIVTTGSIWKFLRLTGNVVIVDGPEYYLDRINLILAILLQIVG